MLVSDLAARLGELMIQGEGDKEIVCYIEGRGEPLEIAEVYYDNKLDEPSLSIRY